MNKEELSIPERTRVFSLKMTENEIEALKEFARLNGLSQASWIRMQIHESGLVKEEVEKQ